MYNHTRFIIRKLHENGWRKMWKMKAYAKTYTIGDYHLRQCITWDQISLIKMPLWDLLTMIDEECMRELHNYIREQSTGSSSSPENY